MLFNFRMLIKNVSVIAIISFWLVYPAMGTGNEENSQVRNSAPKTWYASEYDDDKNHYSEQDGPYVFKQGNRYEAWWRCGDQWIKEGYRDIAGKRIEACQLSAKMPSNEPKEIKSLNIEGDFQVVVASDIHGQFDLFLTLLKNNQIVDQAGKWQFGSGHFVITGDVFDRGPQVIETLWYLYNLQEQAQKVGGGVHLLLGNHEVMVLNGDLRYLHPKYVHTSQVFNHHYQDLFKQGSVLGAWLRSLPVLLKVNGNLYAHGGFHPDLAKNKHSLAEINRVFKSSLVEFELDRPRADFARYLHKTDGPIWYRGYFYDSGATAEEIDLLLQHFEVNKIIVGHTSQDTIETRHQGKVIAVDAKMKNGEYGELLLIDQSQYYRMTLDGKKIRLKAD